MTARRIITVDIGRSTWQGYASESPRLRRDPNQIVGSFVGMSKDDADELLGLMEEAYSDRRINIINLGEGA